MIHLTNKIYLTYAEHSDVKDRIDFRTDDYIQVIDRGLSYIQEEEKTSFKRIAYAKNIEELEEEFGSMEALFLAAKRRLDNGFTNKVIIYACPENFLKILIGSWRSIFPGMDCEAAYHLARVFEADQKMTQRQRENFVSLNKEERVNVMDEYWDFSRQSFPAIYNETKDFELGKELTDDCSIEFLIMNYISSPAFSKRKILEKKIMNQYHKKIMKEICEIKEELETRVYWMRAQEGYEFLSDCKVEDIYKTLREYSPAAFMFDPKVQPSRKGFLHLQQNYSFFEVIENAIGLIQPLNDIRNSNFADAVMKKFEHRTKQEAEEKEEAKLDYYEEDMKISFPLIMGIREKKKLHGLDELLQEELKPWNQQELFYEPIFQGRMNNNLIAFGLILKKENPELLVKYKL